MTPPQPMIHDPCVRIQDTCTHTTGCGSDVVSSTFPLRILCPRNIHASSKKKKDE